MERQNRTTNLKRKALAYIDDDEPCYPEGKPANIYERTICNLNKECYNSSTYARIDDILVLSLFASKRHSTGYRSFMPMPAFSEASSSKTLLNEAVGPQENQERILESTPSMTIEMAIKLSHMYAESVTATSEAWVEEIAQMSRDLPSAFPELFSDKDRKVLNQYVNFLHIYFDD